MLKSLATVFTRTTQQASSLYHASDHFIIVDGKRVTARIPYEAIREITAYHQGSGKMVELHLDIVLHVNSLTLTYSVNETMTGFHELMFVLETHLQLPKQWRRNIAKHASSKQGVRVFLTDPQAT